MYLLPLLWVAGVMAEEVDPFEKPDCDPEMLKEFEETLPTLGQHYIGDYVAIDLPDVEAEHRRVRRGGAGAGGSTGRHPFKMSFEGYGRTFDLRMESNVKKLFHNDLQIIVNSANGTQSKLGLKDIDTSVFYGGYLEREQRSSEVTAHIDRGVLVAHIHTDDGPYFLERADNYIENPPFSNILYRGSDLPQNATEALHGSFEGKTYDRMKGMQREHEGVNENDPQFMERFYQTRNATHRRRTRHKRGGTAFKERRADGDYNMDEYNTCFVALVADHLYVQNVAGGDLQRAISLMTQNTAGATLIYRYSNFYHSVGKGVHFAIKRFQIFETEGAAGNPFANPAEFACGAEGDESALCTRDTPCAQHYLNKLSIWGGGENEFNDVCLAHAFTYRDICFGVLGLAWIGTTRQGGSGICATTKNYQGYYLNTGMTTAINFGSATSMQVRTIALAHEWGHNFGSDHDTPLAPGDISPYDQSCTPGSDGEPGGNYLMYYKATDGDEPYNLMFSPCSLDAIGSVISARGSECFENIDYEVCGTIFQTTGDQFCGDGRVSDTEVCDCGSTNPAICAANDPCCTTECTLVPDAECSNVKSDQCCTSQCKFKGLDFETTMELYTREIPSAGSGSASFAETYEAEFRKRFPSSKNKAGEEENPVPKCAEETSCFREQYCIADPLFKGSCPKMDFVLESTQSVGEQTACFDYGCKLEQDADTGNRCKMELDDVPSCADGSLVTGPCYPFQFSRQKRCNGDKNFCRTDGCTGSLCSGWPMTNVSGEVPSAAWLAEGTNAQARAEPCRLTFIDQNVEVAENVGKECHSSCRWAQDGPCVSTEDYGATPHGQQIAASGSFEAVTLITREPGMSCYYKKDMFAGRCRQVNDNGFVVIACGSAGSSVTVEIDPQAVKRWIKENWGVAVGLIVGGIVLFFLLRWTYKKKKPAMKSAMTRIKNKTIKSRNKTSDNHHATEHAKVPVTSKRHQLLKKQLKASQAIKRLEAFFPGAKRDNVDFKAIVKKVENERHAVKKLLNLGYEFLVPSKVPLLEDKAEAASK